MIEREYDKEIRRASKRAFPFLQKVFTGINFEGPAISHAALDAHPTMLVCSHRSHLDYILLGLLLNRENVFNLRFAAGDNLTNMIYVGQKFRSWGAFPVHRRRAHERTYVANLTQQVIAMLNNGEQVVVFPEGGRSYKGGMLEMKNGIIAAHLIAQYQCPDRTYYFYPFTVSYERLPELPYFELLEKGKRLFRENPGFLRRMMANVYYYGADCIAFGKFLCARRLGINYGEVFVDYAEPFAIKDIVDVWKNYIPGMRNEISAHKVSINKIAGEIRLQLLALYRILPVHVLAWILKQKGSSCTRSEAAARAADAVASLQRMRRNCKSLANLTEYDIIEKGILQLEYTGSLSLTSDKISILKQNSINYYAATCAV